MIPNNCGHSAVIATFTDGMPVSIKVWRKWKQTPEAANLARTYKK